MTELAHSTPEQLRCRFLSTLHHPVAEFQRPIPDKTPTLKFHTSQLRFQAHRNLHLFQGETRLSKCLCSTCRLECFD